MRKEPIRHHYIPQFILRNFACDSDKKLVCYCDKESQSISEREICNVFMERNLYRDEINYASKPVQIEHDLSIYEREVSELIKRKFLDKRKIELTKEEDSMLKLFLAIMSFRNINAKERFGGKISDASKKIYRHFQENGDFEDFWKRNLGYLVKCRSLNDVDNHPQIDDPIKLFMRRDVAGLWGKYLVVVESKDGDGFILGDCYPLCLVSEHRVPLFEVLPISPHRAIIVASVGIASARHNVRILRPGVFDMPTIDKNRNSIIITKRLLAEEVQFINGEIEKNSGKGFVFLKSQIT